jgi:hypothetical protein
VGPSVDIGLEFPPIPRFEAGKGGSLKCYYGVSRGAQTGLIGGRERRGETKRREAERRIEKGIAAPIKDLSNPLKLIRKAQVVI